MDKKVEQAKAVLAKKFKEKNPAAFSSLAEKLGNESNVGNFIHTVANITNRNNK